MALKDWGRFTAIYSTGKEWYLRILGNCETQRFPHGLSLYVMAHGEHNEKQIVQDFQKDVEEWLEDTFGIDTFTEEELEAELAARKKEDERWEEYRYLERHCKSLFPE